jgi:O-antigen ligase
MRRWSRQVGSVPTGTIVTVMGRASDWFLSALMFFPIVDYGLRLGALYPIGAIWDKVALASLAAVALWRYRQGFRPPWFPWQSYAVWFIALILALTAAGLAEPKYALAGAGYYFYYMLFAFLFPFVVDPEEVPRLLHLMATCAVLIALDAIYQYVIKVPIPASWTDLSGHVLTRVFSVLRSPNELGSYMALMAPLLCGMGIAERTRLRRTWYLAGAALCVVALALTFTRGAWVGLAVALMLMAVIYERRFLVPLVCMVAGAYFIPSLHQRVQALFTSVYWIKSSDSGRVAKWLSAFDHMLTNPLFGVGIGKYGGAIATKYHLSTYSDSFYAKTLGETGVVGLILFLALHLRLLMDLAQSVRRAFGRERYLFLGGITGLLAVLIHNSMENVFEYAPMAISYYSVAILLLIRGVRRSEEGVDARPDDD